MSRSRTTDPTTWRSATSVAGRHVPISAPVRWLGYAQVAGGGGRGGAAGGGPPARSGCHRRDSSPAPPRGPLAGRPVRACGGHPRAEPGLQAQALRAAELGHRVPGTRRPLAASARLQRRPDRHPVGRPHPHRARQGRPVLLAQVAAGDGPAGRAEDLDAAGRPPGPVARDVRRRGRPGLGDAPAGAVPAAAGGHRAVPAGLLDAGDLDGLRRVLGEQARPARRVGRGLAGSRAAVAAPALPDGLRPDQRAVDGPRVAGLPHQRLPRLLPPRAAARPRASHRGDPPDRSPQHRLVGAAAVRRRPAGRHLLHGARAGAAARVLMAQLLPRGVLRVAGAADRQRREVLVVRSRPAASRAGPVPPDAGGPDDERVGRNGQPPGAADRRRGRRRAPDGLDALGLQVLARPDHRRQRPGAVP